MVPEWTADVVARMHTAKITTKRLAEESGYTPEYVSMILNGRRSPKHAKEIISAALARLTKVLDT